MEARSAPSLIYVKSRVRLVPYPCKSSEFINVGWVERSEA